VPALKKLIVFTDLDGTLLDHQTYCWEQALPAIEALKNNDYPMVINSSKTAAEIKHIRDKMHNHSPFICENGAVVHLNQNMQQTDTNSMVEVYFAQPYAYILNILNVIKQNYNFNMTGFNDMSVSELMELTDLDEQNAGAAKLREATEPLQWNDSDEALDIFKQRLHEKGLTLTKGGRFHHVMSPVSKGDSINYLMDKYRQLEPDTQWTSAGLGDSFNDISMLEQVDIPVLIKNPHGITPDISHIKNIIESELPGPAGWNVEVLNIINKIKGTQ